MKQDAKVLSVKELTRYIKIKLESDALLQNVWVRGEVSNFTHHSSGHMYFTLKDSGGRIRSIMFASHNQRLAFTPKEGMMVIARGSVSVFERDGQYQLYIVEMQPDGIGSLYLAYEQLREKLEREGLFSTQYKKPIPRFPKGIGVITSPTGAAIRDIITTLQRRYPVVPIYIYPAVVQGKQAAGSVAKAISEMNRLNKEGELVTDVLIVGRGGGSLEELWAFNEEIVARSIFASEIPVISAVGHETDFTIADFVADLRAATPTAAAELAVPHQFELKQQLLNVRRQLMQALDNHLSRKRQYLDQLRKSTGLQYPHRYLLQPAERLDRLREQLAYRIRDRLYRWQERKSRADHSIQSYSPNAQIEMSTRKWQILTRQLHEAIQKKRMHCRHEWESSIRQLDALSPLKVMQRGYSLVYDEKNKLVKSLSQVQPGDLVTVRLSDGQLDCQVWSMKGEEEHG